MNAKRKTSENIQDQITYKEVDFYRDKFAEWLTSKAGKEARGAFFALWAIEIFSRVNVSTFDKEVGRARRTLQNFLNTTYKPE
jgi:hypothetical protein